MSKPLLEVSGLSKKFCRDPHQSLRYFLKDVGGEIFGRSTFPLIREDEFWALSDINFELSPGEVLGVIGHNGAGKSTLINLIAGLIRPTSGRVLLRTKKVALMDHSGGLTSTQTGRENIVNQLSLHGCPSEMIHSKEKSVIEFAEIGSFINAAVGTYSLGMRQRLAFSIYTQLNPDLFIVDEALNGGDLRFRQRFASFLKEYVAKGGSILLCSHALHAIQNLCPRSILLENGKLISSGDTTHVIDHYHQMHSSPSEEEIATSTVIMNSEQSESSFPDNGDEITITSVSATNPEGELIHPGGQIIIRITCNSKVEKDGINYVIEIGNEIWESISTISAARPSAFLSLKPGKNEMTCYIRSLPLAAGTYQIRIYIMAKDSTIPQASFGLENRPLDFVVTKALDPMSNITVYRKNILHLKPEWMVGIDESSEQMSRAN